MSKAQLAPPENSRKPSADTTKAPLDSSFAKSSDDNIQVVVRFRPLNETEIVPST